MDKALEWFNERGIEYVGLRELASVLNIRVSNISYYFPTKDDLVYALSLELKTDPMLIYWRERRKYPVLAILTLPMIVKRLTRVLPMQ